MIYDPAPERGPKSASERLALIAVALAFTGALAAELASEFEPRKLSAVFFVLAWAPLLALHEAGHALVARMLGRHVERVVLGFGARRAEVSVFGLPVEVRTLPLTGFVEMRGGGGSRAADALVYAAGPGIELALAAALGAWFGWPRFLALSDDVGLIAAQAAAAAAVTGAVLNLLPGSTLSEGRETPSDGLGIFLSLFGRRGPE